MRCGVLLVVLAVHGCSGDEPRGIDLWVPCESFGGLRSAIAIPQGTEFRFSLDESNGPHGERGRDHVGTLDMVDAPGFELSIDPDPLYEGWFLARAPNEPGEYTWTIERAERPTTFRVFEPSEVLPVLDEQDYVGRGRTAQIDLALGENLPLCIHDSDEIASVTISGDATCRAVLSTFEFEDTLRASLGDGRFEFQLFGDGACDVAVELANGRTASRRYEPAAPPAPDVDTPERLITSTGTLQQPPIGPGGQCGAAPVDGDCTYPYIDDGDCYWDADWRVLHYELDGTMLDDNAVIGVGLTTRLDVSLTAFLVTLGPPGDLVLDTPADLQLTTFGCDGDYKLIRNRPTAGGSHTIELSSSNTSDHGYKAITAAPVTQTQFRFGTTPSDSTVAPVVDVFTHTSTLLNAEFFGNATRLRGSAPLGFTSSNATAMSGVIDPETLITGNVPHTLVATSTATSDSITINVLDETGITAIGGLQEPVVPRGEQFCLDKPVALTAFGPIYGTPPRGPRVSLGDSLALTPYAQFGGLCLRGIVPGSSTVSWSWGSATVQTQWTIQ